MTEGRARLAYLAWLDRIAAGVLLGALIAALAYNLVVCLPLGTPPEGVWGFVKDYLEPIATTLAFFAAAGAFIRLKQQIEAQNQTLDAQREELRLTRIQFAEDRRQRLLADQNMLFDLHELAGAIDLAVWRGNLKSKSRTKIIEEIYAANRDYAFSSLRYRFRSHDRHVNQNTIVTEIALLLSDLKHDIDDETQEEIFSEKLNVLEKLSQELDECIALEIEDLDRRLCILDEAVAHDL